MRKFILILMVLCSLPAVAEAQTIRKVYAGGATTGNGPTYSLSRLQNALNDAAQNDACGSKILLQQGQTFSAPDWGFVMRQLSVTPTWDCITIQTGVDASGNVLADALFPAAGARMSTGYRSVLAKLVPTVNNSPSIRTVWPAEFGFGCTVQPCIGSGWTLKWLEFSGKPNYFSRAFIQLGTNRDANDPDMPNNVTQIHVSYAPKFLSLLQSDLHGDPIRGQHQALYLASADTRVLNNSFTDIKSMDETQAISECNGVGPYVIENNLLQATGENVMFGGCDSQMREQATITGTPTASTFTLTSTTDLYNNQFIAVQHAGTLHGGLKASVSGSVVTITPALPVTPSVGDVVKWVRIAGGITFRNNWVEKPAAWRNPPADPPTNVQVTCSATGGTLTAAHGPYYYRVSTRMTTTGNPVDNVAYSLATAQVSSSVPSGTTGSCTVTFIEAANNDLGTFIYGRDNNAANQRWSVADGVTTFTDTGTAGAAETAPNSGRVWVVKNNFEMKHGDGFSPAGSILIEGNVFDRSWCCSQNMLVNIKVWNQDGNDVSSTIRGLTFRKNWIRHGVRGINLTTTDSQVHASGYMSDVTIENNLFTDLSSAWGGTYTPVQITSGNYNDQVGSRGGQNIVFQHNTFLPVTALDAPVWFVMATGADVNTNITWRNNIHGRQGSTAPRAYISDAGQVAGTTSWNLAVTGTSPTTNNAWADGNSTTYSFSTSSFFPSDATLQTYFVNFTTCNNDTNILGCALTGTSPLDGAGSDGLDIGADIPAIKSLTDLALAGSGGGGGGGGAVTITTTSISPPAAVTQNSYSKTITVTGGTSPYSCVKVSGTLPTGVTVNSSCVISGTPTTVGTYTFTVRAADTLGATDDQVLTLRTRSRRPAATLGTNERFIFTGTAAPSPLNDRDVLAGDLWRDDTLNVMKWCKTSVSWSCTLWEDLGGASSGTLDGLSDVTITSPATNQMIRYNGSVWTNVTFNAYTLGGNAFGTVATFGTTDAQPINLIAGGTTRLKTDASPTVKAVTLQADGDNNPELYTTKGDCSDWMTFGFNASDCRRVVGQAGGGTFRSMFGLAGAAGATNFIYGIGSSSNSGSTNTRWFGVRQDGLVAIKHLNLETGTRPTCNAAERGTFWYVAGAAGVKDTVEVCTKDAADAYAWRVIY